MNTNNSQAPQLPQTAVTSGVFNLEHLAPYLPYGLRLVARNVLSDTPKRIFSELSSMNIMSLVENDTLYKPILRPLSDFYDINAPAFIDTNFDISTQLVLVDLCSKKQHYSSVRYSDMQEFLREHIDVFNFIEQDLAVSIHDVV